MDLYVARRPIFDADQDVFGYELMFRSGFEEYYAALDAMGIASTDPSAADAIDFVQLAELTNGRRGFVRFTRDLLVSDFPDVIDSELIIVSIPEDVEPDEEVVETCRKLRGLGFTIMLEDIYALKHRFTNITQYADIVKVDFRRATPEERQAICQEFDTGSVRMLADNLETAQHFEDAKELGYSLFEGEFFAQPIEHPGKDISGTKLAYLQVLREVNRPDLSYEELEEFVRQDVSMTYKLLRFMNSAWFGLRYQVSSIKHALVLLGPKEIKKWFSLLVIRTAAQDKPDELVLRALVRAKFAEDLAPIVGKDDRSSDLFLMGMFSLIDALTDMPMMDILDELPILDEIKAALLGDPGEFRAVYDLILAYEKGDWDRFGQQAEAVGLAETVVPPTFKGAMRWATNAMREV